MRVSDVIKTPVKVKKGFGGGFSDSFDNWHIMNDAGTHMGNPCDVTIAECDSWEDAQAIAHCINSHDALVDMVKRLKEKLWDAQSAHNEGDEHDFWLYGYEGVAQDIREADELLKGE